MSKADASKDDEEYWNSSEKHSFSFDQNTEVDNLFGISKSGTAQLKAGISNIEVSEEYFNFDNVTSDSRPLLSVISEPTFTAILKADNGFSEVLPEETPAVDPTKTLRRVLLGQPFSLEEYKSLVDKKSLLDAAIASGNGDAILIVVLFVTKTLKPALAQRLLMERPDAMNVYVHYLSTRLMLNEITDLLSMQGRPIDAAMTNLNVIIRNTRDETRLLQKLMKCYKTQFVSSPECRETPFVQNYIRLLEWKGALRNTKFHEEFDPDSSVLDCLRYSCRDHWGASEGTLVAPEMLLHQHEITPRQYQKVALESRVAVKAWEDIHNLLLSKGWMGSEKLQTNLPIEDILKILHKGEAPTAVLDKFLRYVDPVERRLHLAKAFSCPKTVIEILGTQGDRTSLLEYRDTLIPQSEAFFLAKRTLSSPTIRWKS
ncbi:spermatogenesis-defective protein 39 homolog [Fopius arisanus]|uniref:Spermatogenesis-defective protein 39 homolog n=1 Tax=Fopius arisanus TaxID=64838 RepID=A0A9R1U8D1_9HYME|nr:PREDICTED: spermatogenesis-defective protein 39 homolog [Fopius arisanus]